LGGWLLLEPGPSSPLFEEHGPGRPRAELRCEWDLCQFLRRRRCAEEVIRRHRETHITKADFERIRACGLNAVRLPFGYWVVLGPSDDEPYVGPALEFIDRAVDWAEECNLQIVLDLHGCPGGESGEAPCGHRQRPEGTWHWRQWRQKQSLCALQVIAQRYSGRSCVTGIAVCNEPSNTVPLTRLCRYYAQAVEAIRAAGMPASRVAAVLPIFQRSEVAVTTHWAKTTGNRHENICWDVHCYHCFENEFHGKSLAQHLRAVGDNAAMLRRYPMVVGEWSLALGVAAWTTCGDLPHEEVYRLLGTTQREAFREASHGHFFWNWSERECDDWNFQQAYRKGLLSGPAPCLPLWSGPASGCEDPLEEQLHPSPPEPRVFFGESVFLRVFHGRYVDVCGQSVSAKWADKGLWQKITFCQTTARSARLGIQKRAKREVRHGDLVRLRAHNGRFLTVSRGSLAALPGASRPSAKFVVHVEAADWTDNGDAHALRHRGGVFLQNKASRRVVDADDEAEAISARWEDFGNWQRLVVEKEGLSLQRECVDATLEL